MVDINETFWNGLVAFFSILGGAFGGIPAIMNWINRPKLSIRSIISEPYIEGLTIIFTITNGRLLSRTATEMEIKCLSQNEENIIETGVLLLQSMTNSNTIEQVHWIRNGEGRQPKILIPGLPCGASTEKLFYFTKERSISKFFIFLEYREGNSILNYNYQKRFFYLAGKKIFEF